MVVIVAVAVATDNLLLASTNRVDPVRPAHTRDWRASVALPRHGVVRRRSCLWAVGRRERPGPNRGVAPTAPSRLASPWHGFVATREIVAAQRRALLGRDLPAAALVVADIVVRDLGLVGARQRAPT